MHTYKGHGQRQKNSDISEAEGIELLHSLGPFLRVPATARALSDVEDSKHTTQDRVFPRNYRQTFPHWCKPQPDIKWAQLTTCRQDTVRSASSNSVNLAHHPHFTRP
jgi:hypothetical protein